MGAQTDPVPWGVPASCQSNDGRSAVWASFRVDQAGPVTIDLDGSDFDTIIVLYDGFGNKIACNDDDPTNDPGDFTSRIANELVGSTSLYLVRITGWNGTFSSVGTTELACDNDAGDGTKARVIEAMQADRYYYVRVATLSSASSQEGPFRMIPSMIAGTPSEEAAPYAPLSLAFIGANPFAGTTTFAYTLPAAQQLRLSIYDILGREVAVLVDGARAAGPHEVRFDAAGLPSGVYVARLQSGRDVQATRLTLTR